MLWCRERTRLASHQHPLFVSDLYSALPWRPMLTSRRLVRWNESTGGTIPRMNRNGMNQYAREIILQIHISSLWIEREGTKCASFFCAEWCGRSHLRFSYKSGSARSSTRERRSPTWRTMLEHQSDLVWSLPKLPASRTELTAFPNFDAMPNMW